MARRISREVVDVIEYVDGMFARYQLVRQFSPWTVPDDFQWTHENMLAELQADWESVVWKPDHDSPVGGHFRVRGRRVPRPRQPCRTPTPAASDESDEE